MKKLILMLLVLVGGVMQASATDVTVYFKPNTEWKYSDAWFAVCGQNASGNDLYWEKMTSIGSGVYQATITLNDACTKFFFVRMNPSVDPEAEGALSWNNKWNQSGAHSQPTALSLYDISSVSWTGTWPEDWTTTAITPSSKTFNISNDNCGGDILPNFMDVNSTANNALESNGDFTYSKTVTGNIIRKGTYQFKLYDESDNWYSDKNNSYAAWSVTGISDTEDGIYNIVYTFNYLTGEGSATASKQTGTPTITSKYIIAGDPDLTGQSWDTSGDYNVLDVTDGTGTLTLNGLSLTGNTTYKYKAVQLLCNGDTKYKTIWYSGDNSEYKINRTGVYNATFSCTISTLVSSISTMEEVAGYYIYGSTTGGWSLGNRMTEKNGVYSYTFDAANDYSFCITPNTNLSTDGYNTVSNWANVIRPASDEAVNIDWSTKNKSGNVVIENSEAKKWTIGYNGLITLTYTPGTPGTWTATPYIPCEIKNNNNSTTEGYATFSSDKDVAVPSGVTAFYASANEEGVVTMTKITSGEISSDDGVFLAGAPGTYHFTPATNNPTLITGNYMKKPVNGVVPKNGYVLAKQSGNLGFYKVTADDGLSGQTGKAYLSTTSTAPMLSFDFGEGTTGINEVRSQMEEAREGIFDLQGRRVENPTKGLYIVNGKKVFIK